MLNTFIWGFHHANFSQIILSLQNKKIVDPKIWVGKNKQHCTHSINDFHNFQVKENFHLKKDKNYFELINEMEENTEVIMDMMSRSVAAYGKNYFELKNIYIFYLNYFYYLLKKNKIELILFIYIPHLGVEYILYKIAKKLQIRTIMLNQTLFANKFFIFESIEDFGTFSTSNSIQSQNIFPIKHEFRKDLFYMNKKVLKKIACVKSNFKILRQSINPFKKYKMNFYDVINKILKCEKFKKNCTKYESNVDFEKKYIYFPLHLQPELTTSPLGYKYSDQVLAIEKLSMIIPQDWIIYVKENPKQQEYKRDSFFYHRLSLLSNVKILSNKINTYKLLENCQFVSTITGTVGWEAISGGKNALIFGNAWYKKLDGIFEYNDSINIREILKYKINHTSLQANFNTLMSKTRTGVIELAYSKIVNNFDKNENLFHIEQAIAKQITKEKNV